MQTKTKAWKPRNLYIPGYLDYLGYIVPTILVKNLPENLLKELKKMKVELGCKTWAELLELLVRLSPRETVTLSKGDAKNIRNGVNEFLELSKTISKKWVGPPSVLEEFRKSRRHGNS